MTDELHSPAHLPASSHSLDSSQAQPGEEHAISSLNELLEQISSRRFLEIPYRGEMGLVENLAFPFLAIVGQQEMKLSLLLSLINPNIGGVLLIGPRGTGKTTAARSLIDLLPNIERSLCPYGCLPQDIECGGIDTVCPECAKRYGQGESLTFTDQVRFVELPLNAALEDVVGGLDERARVHHRMRLSRGILAQADQNVLYVDEINLLSDDIVDAILDASAQGMYTVHRGPLVATYRARFILVGSMNPEEGELRPQIMDRFGLRVTVHGLDSPQERLEAYRRTVAYRNNPRQMFQAYAEPTQLIRDEIISARDSMSEVLLSPKAEAFGLKLIQELKIDSLRAEITLFEAARAHAIADGRKEASLNDIHVVSPMALRLRRSRFMKEYLSWQAEEVEELNQLLKNLTE